MSSMVQDAALSVKVETGLLARLGVTWEPNESYLENIRNAVAGAIAMLRSVSGNPALSFEGGDDLDLVITCAWYLAENRRAEFMHEYVSELNWLRIREVTKDGTDENASVS